MSLTSPAAADRTSDHIRKLTQRRVAPAKMPDHVIRLEDGRRLGYSEYGHATGRPVFFFHGFGTSRVICPPDENPVNELGLRLIAVDRPGIGLSEALPGRTLLDWPTDVVQLAIGSGSNPSRSSAGPVAVRTPSPAGMRCQTVFRPSVLSAHLRRLPARPKPPITSAASIATRFAPRTMLRGSFE